MDEENIAFTVYGRMGTGKFQFNINNTIADLSPLQIAVNNSQCEVDAGFECDNSFVIVEAKNQLPQDFLVRQLYYPYRIWEKRTRKPIVPIYLTYVNDVFTLSIGRFNDVNSYNSLEITSQHRFSLIPRSIELDEVEEKWKTAESLPEPSEPTFPQADSFVRVFDLMTQLANAATAIPKDELTQTYAFSTRQTEYYTDAGRYLGFVEKTKSEDGKVAYQLTRLGKRVMALPARARNLAIIEQVLRFRVFHRALGLYFHNRERPAKEDIVRVMRDAKLKKLGEDKTTVPRRAQTVLSWLDWMLELTTA